MFGTNSGVSPAMPSAGSAGGAGKRDVGGREHDTGPVGRVREPPVHESSERSGEHCGGRHAGAGQEQRPPIRTHGGGGAGSIVSVTGGSPAGGRRGRRAGDPVGDEQHGAGDAGGDQRRDGADDAGVPTGGRGEDPDDPEHDGTADGDVASPPHGCDPDERGEDAEHGEDADHEGGLVVRPEPVDRQLLDAGRDTVDDAVADAHHRRRQAAGRPRHHLGHAEAERRSQHAHQRSPPHRRADRRGGRPVGAVGGDVSADGDETGVAPMPVVMGTANQLFVADTCRDVRSLSHGITGSPPVQRRMAS